MCYHIKAFTSIIVYNQIPLTKSSSKHPYTHNETFAPLHSFCVCLKYFIIKIMVWCMAWILQVECVMNLSWKKLIDKHLYQQQHHKLETSSTLFTLKFNQFKHLRLFKPNKSPIGPCPNNLDMTYVQSTWKIFLMHFENTLYYC